MCTEQSRIPRKSGLSGFIDFVQVQGFWIKTLHLPPERRGAPVEIRIVTMAGFHKNASFEAFLWNCAVTVSAQINRKTVYSADIKIKYFAFRVSGGFFTANG